MKLFFTAVLIIFTYVNGYCQDANLEAKANYINAEEAYNNSKYWLCIENLQKAEKALGKTNPKIMDLKTRAWATMVLEAKSVKYTYVLDTCLKKFFGLANSDNYPEEKYMQMINLKNKVEDFKRSVKPEYALFYKKDYTEASDTELINLFSHKLKSNITLPFVSSGTKISASEITTDTLTTLYEDEGKNHYAIPIKTGDKEGYLFWFYASDKIGSWYMGFKDLAKQKLANQNKKSGFFANFNMKWQLNPQGKLKKYDSWPDMIIQNSAIKLEPNTEYYIWFSSNSKSGVSETKSIPINYALYLTDDPEVAMTTFLKSNDKLIRLK